MAERVGFARDSNARRRSHLVWAPARRIFLLKNPPPPFESALSEDAKRMAPAILFALRGLWVKYPQV